MTSLRQDLTRWRSALPTLVSPFLCRYGPVLMLATMLNGCALFRPASVVGPGEVQRQALLEFRDWLLEGRIAVSAGAESWSAGIDWRHRPVSEHLRLSGPLGQGAVEVFLTGGFIRITQADGRTEVSSQPELLLRQRLGFPVPLAALQYWVLGLPEPESPVESVYEADGQLGMIRQQGWTIDYERYMAVGELVLPQKLNIEKEGVKLKLLIDRWHGALANG